jgi:hypothetical protein
MTQLYSEGDVPRINPGPPCQVCGVPSAARNLCAKHLKRWQRHGHIEETRPKDWGARERHPLYVVWARSRRIKEGMCEEWQDFWKFVASVGERPSPKHWLARNNPREPFGPQNCYWKETFSNPDHAARMRDWRSRNLTRSKEYYLKKNFGIGLTEYDRLLEAQDGKCAICQKEESYVRANGARFALAVDHCHNSSKIRGLLCAGCNRGLGLFGDSAELLEAAAKYLRLHAEQR